MNPETPNTVHGRLLEAAHISGYSFERACTELEWLLEDNRWEKLGFKDGPAFVESLEGAFVAFKTSLEQRKPLAQKLTRIASQRATAKALGISHTTVQRTLDGTDVPDTNKNSEENQDVGGFDGTDVPNHFNTDPSKAAKAPITKSRKQQEASKRNAAKIPAVVPEGKFAAIYADPPWSFKVWSGEGKDRAAENHYPTMTLEDIKALSVADKAADDCALFLWAVMPQLPEAFGVIRAWGFEYKTCAFVWVKTTKDGERFATGMGYWTRANAEICLLATKGFPKRLNADVHQIISPRTEHSRKPDEVPERIERLVSGPYLELFARRPRDGWQSWGNE